MQWMNNQESCHAPAFPFQNGLRPKQMNKGQAIVEFTLIFMLLLIITLIPADFGLAFFTGQLALSASREGARIAAADPLLLSKESSTPCALASCAGISDIHGTTAARLSSALLPDATVTVDYDPGGAGATCNKPVRVTVTGTYSYFFYHLLNWFGFSVSPSVPINYSTDMRWEHQC